MNRTLKKTLTKLAIETGGDWVTLLPFALFQVRNTPYKLNLTPFEILYGRPPPVCPVFEGKCLPHPLCLGCCNEPISGITIATLFSLGLAGAGLWDNSSKL